MKSPTRIMCIIALLLGVSQAAGLRKRDCATDICIRQVWATKTLGHAIIASSDCSSYLTSSTRTVTVTVTPGYGVITTATAIKTVEVISTETETTTIADTITLYGFTFIVSTTIAPEIVPRHNPVPTYASACTSRDQYVSACSCYGILPPHTKTVTAHSRIPPTVSKIITTTRSSVTTDQDYEYDFVITTERTPIYTTITAQPDTFALCVTEGVFAGFCAVAFDDTTDLLVVGLEQDTPYESGFFYKITNEKLYSGSYVAQDASGGFVFSTPGSYDFPTLVCSVVNGLLSCEEGNGAYAFWGCIDTTGEIITHMYFYPLGVTPDITDDDCYIIDLHIIYP